MNKIQKPAWLIFGNECGDKLGAMDQSKSGNREQRRVEKWFKEAREKLSYPGTFRDWCALLNWRAKR